MYYIVYLHLPCFYLRERVRPDFETSTARVIHREKIILESDEIAQYRGVLPGMSLPQAKAILERAEWLEWREEEYRGQQESWLNQITPYSDVIEPDAQHSAWVDLSMHPRPYEVAMHMADAIHTWGPQIGAGRNKWLAKWSLHTPGDPRSVIAPVDYLESQRVEALLPLGSEIHEKLRALGCEFVRDLATISDQLLLSYFGKEAFRIRKASRGLLIDPVRATFPENSLSEWVQFPSAVDNELDWEMVCTSIAEKIGAKLQLADVQSNDLQVQVELESGTWQSFQRTFAKPIWNVLTVRTALSLMLSGAVESAAVAIRVRLQKLRSFLGRQGRIDGSEMRERKQELALQALQRVRSLYGEQAILMAADVPIERNAQLIREWEHVLGLR